MKLSNHLSKETVLEVWKNLNGYYLSGKKIKSFSDKSNLLVKIGFILLIFSTFSIKFINTSNFPGLLEVIYKNQKTFVESLQDQNALFRFAMYTILSKFLFSIILCLIGIYLLKMRIFYAMITHKNSFKNSINLAFNPFCKSACIAINEIDKKKVIVFSELINNVLELQKFPQIEGDYVVKTKNLSFMYHWDSDWDKYLHLLLKRFFPSIYNSHLIKKNTVFKNEEKFKKDPMILKKINIRISPKKFTTILGCNGSSKSTLLKAIINLFDKYSGTIVWIGKDLKKISYKSFYKNVAYISQENSIQSKITVYDYVACGLFPSFSLLKMSYSKNEPEVLKNLEKIGLLDKKDRDINSLSGGEKQKAIIARVLTQQTQIIILDEPTTYLDINNQYMILNLLKRLQQTEGKTIITILHDVKQAMQFSDEVILLKDGEIHAHGECEEVMNEKNIEEVFGVSKGLLYL